MNPWEQDDPVVQQGQPWEAADPVVRKAPATEPAWEANDPVQAPSWGTVVKSLPEQFGTGLESATTHLRLMKARENFAQRELVDQAGFATTPAGAATGLVRQPAVTRQLNQQAEDFEQTQVLEKEAASASELKKIVTPQGMTFGQQVVSSIAQSAAPTMAGLAVGIVTKNPALAMAIAGGGGGALQGGATYEEAGEKGATHRQAARAAGIDTILEGIGEAIPLGYALKEGTPIFRRLFGTMAAEAGQEAATQAMQDFHAFLSYNPDITLQEAWDNIKVAAVSGALMGGFVGGAAQAAEASRQPTAQLFGPSGEVLDTQRLKNTVRTDDTYRNLSDSPADIPTPTKTPSAEALAVIASIDATLLDEAQVETARARVKAHDEKLRSAPVVPETTAKLEGLNDLNAREDFGAIAESSKVANKGLAYINENDAIPRNERPVLYAPEGQDVVGLQLQQVQLTPGVYTIGNPTADRDAETLKVQHELLEQWRQQLMPNATILMLNEGLPTRTAGGWHSLLSSGVHVITPPVLRKRTSGPMNTNMQGKILYTLAHEFGHGLIHERFFEGVDPFTAVAIRDQSQRGMIDEEMIAQVADPLKQAVLREFNSVKQRILSGEMTAAEFHQEWMNPGKVHVFSLPKEYGVPGHAPAIQLVDAIVRRAYKQNEKLDTAELLKLRNEYLSLDEYFAEQVSRFAYTKEWDVNAPPLAKSFMGKALASMRDALLTFFKQLKEGGVLAPGVRFQEWMNSLTKDPLHALPTEKLAKPKKAKAAKKAEVKPAKAAPKAPKAPKAKPVEQLDHNVATAPEARQKAARAAVISLVRDGTLEKDGEVYKELMAFVKSADFDSFTDTIQPYLEKKVKFELDSHEDLVAAFAPPEPQARKLTATNLHDKLYTLGYTWYIKDDEFILEKDGQEVPYEAQPPEIQQTAGELHELINAEKTESPAFPAPPKDAKTPEDIIENILSVEDKIEANPALKTMADQAATALGEKGGFVDVPWGGKLYLEGEYEALGLLNAMYLSISFNDQSILLNFVNYPTAWSPPQYLKVKAPASEQLIRKLEKHLVENHAAAGYPNVPYWLQRDVDKQLTEESALDTSTLAFAAREWKEKGFASRFFKAYFGDWQTDPANSSKVVTANGEPLVQYHATPAWFEAFGRGDIGFHFGTLRAAHNRVYSFTPYTELSQIHEALMLNPVKYMQGTQNDIQFLPVVLDIRNPLYIGSEGDGAAWVSPTDMTRFLVRRKIITEEEASALKQVRETALKGYLGDRREDRYKEFAPVRQLLMDKGYDGIKYENTIEGDTSWVAFRPEQVKSVLNTGTFSRSPKIRFELDFDESDPQGFTASRFYQKFKGLVPNPKPLRRALRYAVRLKTGAFQLQQHAHLNPGEEDLQFMLQVNGEFNRKKGALQASGDDIARRWRDLSKENNALVSKFLQAHFDSGELWLDLARENKTWIYKASPRFREKLIEHGINADTALGQELAGLILEIQNSLLEHINEAEDTLLFLAARKYAGNPEAQEDASKPIAFDIHELRKRPFLPQGRFGNHLLIIEKKRESRPGYEVVHREAFETTAERAEARAKYERRLKPDERIKSADLEDNEYVLMSLPRDFLESVITELGLGEKERDKLHDLLIPVKSERLLKPYDRERLRLPGASEDVLRSYSNFIWHNSNLLAKTRYRANFNLAIQGMKSKLRRAEYAGDEPAIARYGELHRFMQNTRDHVLNPPAEAYTLRSLVALTYLIYNVKTALLNLFGLATSWSDITTRLGQVEGNEIMTRAMWQTMRAFNPFDLNARRRGDYLDDETQAALDRALKEGQLSQSYAYYLAGMANSNNLIRMPGSDVIGKAGRHFVDLGMWSFRLTELSARRATFLSQFEAARRLKAKDPEAWEREHGLQSPYDVAVIATNKLQNDFSQGNTAPFLRGGKGLRNIVPLVTVFMSFTQHMAFHTFGGYGTGLRRADKLAGRDPKNFFQSYTLKIMLMLLLLAGYEGLPGAENILDLVDAVWKKWFGKPVRQDIREGLRNLTRNVMGWESDPLALAHGAAHNTNFFGLTGDSRFDVSRSIGFGRVFPGTDVLSRSSTGDIERDVGSLALNLMGPAGGILNWLLRTGFGAGGWQEGMKRAPGAIGNIYNGFKWSEEGVLAPDRSRVTRDLKTGELRDLTTGEIFGKVLGFNPTVVSANREILFAQHDARMYWTARRDRLLDDMWKARDQQDREAMADVRKAIDEYNEWVPEQFRRELRLTPKQLADSYKARSRQKRLSERGLPHQKRYRGLYRDIRESYDPSAGREVPEQ